MVLFDRILGNDGDLITIPSVTTITARVFLPDGTQVGADITVNKNTTVFNTLQTATDDPRYTGEGGFNFRMFLPGTYLLNAGVAVVNLWFTDTSNPANLFVDSWEIVKEETLE